ncbi:MAG: hypothetical protein DMF06_14075 [Verrucomicrobia bacterium]|nr:MAG: hypothetical protein DMF06_14075 [Verrucomicrobiota bacterium]
MNNVIISNRTNAARKRGAAIVALLASLLLGHSSSAALDLGNSTGKTPYDPYMGPVWSVFGKLGGTQPDPAQVEQWVAQGRAFRYSFSKSQPYVPQSPDQTESSRSGDCKAKSLWLADKMDSKKVRFVIGKFKRGAAQSHAWLIWNGPNGWLILDATMFSRSLDPARVSSNEFIPIYSYAPGGKYTHAPAAAKAESKYGDHL